MVLELVIALTLVYVFSGFKFKTPNLKTPPVWFTKILLQEYVLLFSARVVFEYRQYFVQTVNCRSELL